jgi:hypothetical protein
MMTPADALRRFLPLFKTPAAFSYAGTLAAELRHLPIRKVQEPAEISHHSLAALFAELKHRFDIADQPPHGRAIKDPGLRPHYVRAHLALFELRRLMSVAALQDIGADPYHATEEKVA